MIEQKEVNTSKAKNEKKKETHRIVRVKGFGRPIFVSGHPSQINLDNRTNNIKAISGEQEGTGKKKKNKEKKEKKRKKKKKNEKKKSGPGAAIHTKQAYHTKFDRTEPLMAVFFFEFFSSNSSFFLLIIS
jgi:hypothetical protein